MNKGLFAAASAAFLLAGCVKPPPTTPVVSSIAVTPETASVGVGITASFSAVAKDAAGNTIGNVTFTWRSSNTAVAAVAQDGKATGVAPGQASITAAVGAVTSAPATLTVAGAGAAFEGKSAQSADGTVWRGGGDVLVRAGGTVGGKTVASADLSITNAGALKRDGGAALEGSHAKVASLTIPGALNPLTRRGVKVTITRLYFADGSSAPPVTGTAELTLNLDNEKPTAEWVDPSQRRGSLDSGCGQFPFDTTKAITPGTELSWGYTGADAGAGVARVSYYNFVQRSQRRATSIGDGAIYSSWLEFVDASGAVGRDFQNVPSLSGTAVFRTLGHGKGYVVQAIDALGNASDWNFDGSPARDNVCNGYWNESGYPYSPPEPNTGPPTNPSYNDALNYHTIPEIDRLDVTAGTSFSAAGVRPNPPVGAVVCTYCGRGQIADRSLEVRFYRKLKAEQVFRYLGRAQINEAGDATVPFTAPALPSGTASDYDYAAVAVNTRSAATILNTIAGNVQLPPAASPAAWAAEPSGGAWIGSSSLR